MTGAEDEQDGGEGVSAREDPVGDERTQDGAGDGRAVGRAGEARPSGLMLAAAVLAVIALVSGSVFAYLLVTGDDGGKASPTDATTQLLAALGQADPIGVLELLPAGERDALKGSVPDLVAQLQRLHLLTTYDGHRVGGVTITSDSVTQQTTPLGGDIVAVDLIAGHLTVQSDGAQLPVTDEARTILEHDFDLDPAKGRATRDFAQYPLRLVTVKEGGTWRVSLAYSVAENLRGRASAAAPTIGKGPAPKGGATPEAAVRSLFDAYAAEDPRRAAALLLPDEMRAFSDYANLLVPPTPEQRAEAIKGKDLRSLPIDERLALTHTATVNHLDLDVEGDGATRRVKITSLDFVIVGEVQREHLVYDGSCLTVDYRFGEATKPYARFSSCTPPAAEGASTDPDTPATTVDPDRTPTVTTADPDAPPTTADGDRPSGTVDPDARPTTTDPDQLPTDPDADPDRAGPRRPPHDNPLSTIAVFGKRGGLPAFTVVQQGGAWYVSPTRSVVDSVLDTLKVLEPDTVDAFVARVKTLTAVDSSDAAKETTDPDNQLFGPRAVATNRLIAACFVEVMTVVGEESSADPSIGCVQQLVADNKVRADAVAPMLLGECYSVPPTEPPSNDNPYRGLYLKRAATRDCFQKAVDDGVVPDYTVKNHLGKEQGCFATYDALARTAPEADWAAADAIVKTCVDKELQDSPGQGPRTDVPGAP